MTFTPNRPFERTSGARSSICGGSRAVLAVAILSFAGVSQGCAAANRMTHRIFGGPSARTAAEASGKPAGRASALAESERPLEAPLTLNVVQAFYDGPRLHLKVRLDAKTTISADEVIVSVAGLKDGQIREVHDQRLQAVVPFKRLSSGESAVVPFVLDGTGLSEYQVGLTWGEEAKLTGHGPFKHGASNGPGQPAAARASLAGPGAAVTPHAGEIVPPDEDTTDATVILRDVELERHEVPCDEPPCELRYTVHAILLNNGRTALTEVGLASGFVWVEEGTQPAIPADFQPLRDIEEPVTLKNLGLQGGTERKLKVNVDRPVPDIPGGSFQPYLRIVEVR